MQEVGDPGVDCGVEQPLGAAHIDLDEILMPS